MTIITLTADDENPDCGRCDYINASEDLCVKLCGAEHGWSLYERSECIKAEGHAVNAWNHRVNCNGRKK